MSDPIDAPPRGAMILVRFTAVGLIGLGLLEPGLYAAECAVHREAIPVGPVLLRALPLAAGITVLVKARALADWLSEFLD